MKRIFLLIIITLVFSCKSSNKQLSLPLHNKKVLILGNSITQHGTYVDFLEYYLRKNYPNDTLDIISIGLSSETASGNSETKGIYKRPCVHSRLDDALKLIKPELVIACYGINDGIYSNFDSTRFNDYKNGILQLKAKVENTKANIILMTSTPFDASRKQVAENGKPYSYKHPFADYNTVLKTYATWVNSIENTKIIDLHSYMNKHLMELKNNYPDSTFIPDGVHPNEIGHFYMAKKIVSDLYPDISIGNPLAELDKIKSDSLFILASNRRQIRSRGWLDYIGYTRRHTVKSDDIQPTIKAVKQLGLAIKDIQNLKRN